FLLRNQVEAGDGKSRGEEQGQVNVEHLEPALVEADDHGGQQKHREHDHERIAEICREVIPGFELHLEGSVAAKNARQNLDRRLNQALGPARLLCFKSGHLDRECGGAFQVLQIEEAPAVELSAIGEVGVLGEGVVLPAASIFDGL